ncbi:protein of unknown function DUF1232 [Chloroherpeton thalassium ATCC 35110]|uniref:DUF1232 domain-containing protein n=1 Tax=Chloroherpeton thalassium (strain ATCC 35110 / GB-78) TaxID=517418 RepID=B3QWX0_CHLT3|nr:YkvA family protein [Chloroherpeton thalassium]ACF13334.1 protein of unknown function DUF1232 [Chloroherpeton thalassium ATCC 35110]
MKDEETDQYATGNQAEENPMGSASFKRAKKKAENYAKNPKKAQKLLDDALNKIESFKADGKLGEVLQYLQAFIRMIRAYSNKSYTTLPLHSVVMAIAALIYFVSPIDAIFDFIPIFGLVDDAAVITAIFGALKNDISRFLEWEAANASATQETPYIELESHIKKQPLERDFKDI